MAEPEDPFLLASHLHANVKFFGELLTAIGPESTQADLLDVAKNTYGLNWTSLDPVRRRTSWLRSLGMVELWGQKVVRTSSGDQLLDQLELCLPDEARGLPISEAEPSVLDNDVLDFLSGIAELDQEALRQRRPLIGYIPRGVNSTSRDTELLR